jgi:hypothetical protein
MEIKMVRGVKDGHAYEKIYLNGIEYPYHMASRLLTNTTSEAGLGIFQQHAKFWKGDIHQEFTFEPLGEFGSDEFIKRLQDRIKTVREWVKSIDYEKQMVFQVPDEQ